MTPLELLFERAGTEKLGIPPELAQLYAGDLGFPSVHTYANFVSSLDGVVAVPGGRESGRIVSGGNEADRFVMGLLRAFADAVVIGAGTFRHSPRALWTPAHICPDKADAFAELRRALGLRPEPLLVVVSASGELDLSMPALKDALIATTSVAKEKLGRRALAFASDRVPAGPLFEHLRGAGHQRILTEGGPSLFGELVAASLVDEVFLTTSPRLFGRSERDGKKSLIEGVELEDRVLELVSVRRHGSHLFLRYAL
jgi:riboflavin biosynthesis pyrimidine reductase